MIAKKKQPTGSATGRKEAESQNNAMAPVAISAIPTSNPEPAAQPSPKPPTKRASVLELLRRDDGATLPELMAATGWQAHSVRAVLTGLRKSGIVLEKSIRNGATCYQILEVTDARS